MNSNFNLITYKKSNKFWYDTVAEFQNVILEDIAARKVYNKYGFLGKTLNRFSKYKFLFKILRIFRLSKDKNLMVLMGTSFQNCLPHFITSPNNSIYLFDAWPNCHNLIFQTIDSIPIKNIFVSSSIIAEILNKENKNCNFIWLPEGIDINQYKYKDYKNKDIDIIDLGRKYQDYEDKVAGVLEKHGKNHYFEDFPTREGFIEGLSRSKISICVPRCIIDPEGTGRIPTMTNRYLQSMASKCLIIGNAPQETIELFGYNPVIEIDNNHPQEQIIDILNNFESYIPLIERNYEYVKLNHTWFHRLQVIKKYL